jgi:hypothetical protein
MVVAADIRVDLNPQTHGIVIPGRPLSIYISVASFLEKTVEKQSRAQVDSTNNVSYKEGRSISMHSLPGLVESADVFSSSTDTHGYKKQRSTSLGNSNRLADAKPLESVHSELLDNRSFEPATLKETWHPKGINAEESHSSQDYAFKERDMFRNVFGDLVVDPIPKIQDLEREILVNSDFSRMNIVSKLKSVDLKDLEPSPQASLQLIVGYIHIYGLLTIHNHNIELTKAQIQQLNNLYNAEYWYPPPHQRKPTDLGSIKDGGIGKGFWFVQRDISKSKNSTSQKSNIEISSMPLSCPILCMPPMVLDCDQMFPLSWKYHIDSFPLDLPSSHLYGNSFKLGYHCVIGLQVKNPSLNPKASIKDSYPIILEIPLRVISFQDLSKFFSIDRPILLRSNIATLERHLPFICSSSLDQLDLSEDTEFSRSRDLALPLNANLSFQIKHSDLDLFVLTLYDPPFCLDRVILGRIDIPGLSTSSDPSVNTRQIHRMRVSLLMKEIVYGKSISETIHDVQEIYGPGYWTSIPKPGVVKESKVSDPLLKDTFSSPISLLATMFSDHGMHLDGISRSNSTLRTSICQVEWFIRIQCYFGSSLKMRFKQMAGSAEKKICCERDVLDRSIVLKNVIASDQLYTDPDYIEDDHETSFECEIPIIMNPSLKLYQLGFDHKRYGVINSSRLAEQQKHVFHWKIRVE